LKSLELLLLILLKFYFLNFAFFFFLIYRDEKEEVKKKLTGFLPNYLLVILSWFKSILEDYLKMAKKKSIRGKT